MKKLNKQNAIEHLWRFSDDAIWSGRYLSEIYNNVPKELDCMIYINEFHEFPKEKRKAIKKWLNRK